MAHLIRSWHSVVTDNKGVYNVSGYSGGGLMIKCEHPQYKTKPNTSVKNQTDVQRGRIQEFRMNGWRMEMFLYMTTPEQESWWCFLESWKLQMQEHTGVEWKYLTILRASLNFSWASDTVRNKKLFIACLEYLFGFLYIFLLVNRCKISKNGNWICLSWWRSQHHCQIPEEHKFISVKRMIITSVRTSAHLKWHKWVVHLREMKREFLQWASVMWAWEMLEFTGVEQKPETHIWLSSPWPRKYSSTSSAMVLGLQFLQYVKCLKINHRSDIGYFI